VGRTLRLVNDERWQYFNEKREVLVRERQRFQDTWIRPNTAAAAAVEKLLGQSLTREYRLADLLLRPETGYRELVTLPGVGSGIDFPEVIEQLENEARYAGYIERQQDEIQRRRRHEETEIPEGLDFREVRGLSNEVRQTLTAHRPSTLGQAGRISGVTPTAISLLLVYLKKRSLQSAA